MKFYKCSPRCNGNINQFINSSINKYRNQLINYFELSRTTWIPLLMNSYFEKSKFNLNFYWIHTRWKRRNSNTYCLYSFILNEMYVTQYGIQNTNNSILIKLGHEIVASTIKTQEIFIWKKLCNFQCNKNKRILVYYLFLSFQVHKFHSTSFTFYFLFKNFKKLRSVHLFR